MVHVKSIKTFGDNSAGILWASHHDVYVVFSLVGINADNNPTISVSHSSNNLTSCIIFFFFIFIFTSSLPKQRTNRKHPDGRT